MPFVADNSVVLAWFVKGQATEYSERLLGRVARESVFVPVVWHVEFANALRQLERRRKLTPEGTALILDGVDGLSLQPDPSPPSQRRLLDLARQYDLSVYEASYLELAIRLSLRLAAQDGPLVSAAAKAGLRVD